MKYCNPPEVNIPVRIVGKTPIETMLHILTDVSVKSGVPVKEIRGKKRYKHIMAARHITIFRLKKETNATLKYIGEFIGGKDHTTVLNSVKIVRDMIETKNEMYTNLLKQYL